MTNQVIMNVLNDPKPHFVLVPLLAQGHMIPMIDLAHLLAGHGVLVTFITTPFNASRIRTTINRAQEDSLPINFVELPFPCKEMGLPEGCESMDVVPSAELMIGFFRGMALLGKPLESLLRELKPYPNCMISDTFQPWTQDVAQNLKIPRLSFFSICCFTLLCTHNISCCKIYDSITDEHESFEIPGLVQKIIVTKAQAPGLFDDAGWERIGWKIKEADFAAHGIVVNTFEFLEPLYIESYQKALSTKVWAVGPFSLRNKTIADAAARGDKASIDADRCLNWLDSKKPRSVVYVSFGSLTVVDASQLMEVGLGLEASNHPFVWVINNHGCSPELEEWLSKEFAGRIGSNGLIIKGWAPQVMILSHPATGGFMTHCGWNSTLEAVSAGVPMVTWPGLWDQFLNERMIVDVLGIGVSVGVKEPGIWAKDEKSQKLSAKRDDVERAVRSVMDAGEEAKKRRMRAEDLGEKAREAMQEEGSSFVNMKNLIQCYSVDGNERVEGK